MTATAAEDRTEVVGRRIGAGLIDLLVLFVLGFVLALFIGDTQASNGNASFNLEGAQALVWLGLALAYYAVLEATTGQTLGKRLLGVRVASRDGGDASAGQVLMRTVFRLIDGIAFYLVGLVSVLATGERRQRLGDLVARTTVVGAETRR
jgi:uncharacterized RDD family membrane protein YckC